MSVLQRELNRAANAGVYRTPSATVGPSLAANQYAGTTGLDLVGALNAKAGNTTIKKDLQGVLNQISGTSGLAIDAAARALTP